MDFINDIAADFAWLDPAPIGTVEPGWTGIVRDMLREIGDAVAIRPGTTVDVLAIAERDGALLFDAVVDGVGADDDEVATAVASAASIARTRAAATCAWCGRPGRLRLDRAAWPATRCDRHAPGADERSRHVALTRASEDTAERRAVATREQGLGASPPPPGASGGMALSDATRFTGPVDAPWRCAGQTS